MLIMVMRRQTCREGKEGQDPEKETSAATGPFDFKSQLGIVFIIVIHYITCCQISANVIIIIIIKIIIVILMD